VKNLPAIFVTSFTVALSGALMPGPLLVMTISRAAQDGFWTGPLLQLGHVLAEVLTIYLLIKGLGKLLSQPRIFGIIAVVGAGVLVWMGVSTFGINPEEFSLAASGAGAPASIPDPVSGALLSLTNPNWVLWWATIGSVYLAVAQELGMKGIAAFFSGHILADIAWYCLVAALVATGSRFLTPQIYGIVLKVLGVALIGIGGYFLFSGVRSFWRARNG